MPSMRQLLLLVLLVLPSYHYVAATSIQENWKDDRDDTGNVTLEGIVQELETFIGTEIEPSIKRFLEWKRQTKDFSIIGPDCLLDPPGRLLRHRCCVVFSNLAAALLYARYARPVDDLREELRALQDYHTTRRTDLHPQEMDMLLRLWAVNNKERRGIYHAPLRVGDVDLILSKCEILDAHTYLTLQLVGGGGDDRRLIVDMSWKQIPLMTILTDQTGDRDKNAISQKVAKVLRDRSDFLVFVQPDAATLFSVDELRSILKRADLLDPSNQQIFDTQYAIVLQLYSVHTTNMICGKTSEEIMEEQQRLMQIKRFWQEKQKRKQQQQQQQGEL